MPEENLNSPKPKPTEPTPPNVPAQTPAEPSNADFKNTPAYKSMASQIADFQKKDADRVAAEQAAKDEAERKDLESKGEYEKLAALHKQQLETIQAQHAADIQQRDLKTELLKAGVNNDTFIAGAIAGYTEGDIGEYVKGLAGTESNKIFFGQQQRQPVPAPGTPGFTGGAPIGEITNLDDYKKAIKSRDPDVQARAIAWSRANFGKMLNQ